MNILFAVYLIFLFGYVIYSVLILAYLRKNQHLGKVCSTVSTLYIVISLVIINVSLIVFLLGGSNNGY
ncbi:MAG: hypothetical protein WCW17_03290 [Patescibacteria group bacterium]|jgi:hypothetical protein